MTWFLAALTAPVWLVLAWATLGDLLATTVHHANHARAQETER